jgi:acyl-coenzyme A thioesterase PaaI-like protein
LTSEAPVNVSDVRIGGSRIVLEPHNCFACGTLNVHGLALELHASDDRCWTELVLPERFQGWEGIAHGGIVTTILDEVMGWALIDHDMWGVTARMTIEFKHPVPICHLIRGEGRVARVRRRLVDAEGIILDPADGSILARAEATFVGASEAKKRELKARYGFAVAPDVTTGTDTPESVDISG